MKWIEYFICPLDFPFQAKEREKDIRRKMENRPHRKKMNEWSYLRGLINLRSIPQQLFSSAHKGQYIVKCV